MLKVQKNLAIQKLSQALGMTLCLGVLLTGCSKPNTETTATQQTAQTSNNQRQITDALGHQVSVPDQPKKVIVLSELDLDSTVALGVTPIGGTYVRGQSTFQPYLATQTQSITALGNFGQPSMEKVLSLQPDLILAGGLVDTQLISQLGQIAPTAVSFSRGEAWQDSFKRIANLLNKDEQAQTVLATYQQHTAKAKQQLAAYQGQTVSVIRWTANGPVYMYKDSFASQILADIGLTRPAQQQQAGASHSAPISRERYDQIDADWLIIGSALPADEQLAQLKKLPEFNRLKAVQNQHYVIVDAALWTGVGGPNAANKAVDDITNYLLQK